MRVILALLFTIAGCIAQAETSSSFKIQPEIDGKKLKGVVCTLSVGGEKSKLETPVTVKLPVDGAGRPNGVSITCTYDGVTRKVTGFPKGKTTRIAPNFGSMLGTVYFYKSNGGLTGYQKPDGTIVLVP